MLKVPSAVSSADALPTVELRQASVKGAVSGELSLRSAHSGAETSHSHTRSAHSVMSVEKIMWSRPLCIYRKMGSQLMDPACLQLIGLKQGGCQPLWRVVSYQIRPPARRDHQLAAPSRRSRRLRWALIETSPPPRLTLG